MDTDVYFGNVETQLEWTEPSHKYVQIKNNLPLIYGLDEVDF